VGDEVYGFPPAWPAAFEPEEDDLDELRALCERVVPLRGEAVADVQDWIDQGGDPIVYVSLGSFLSVRGDVLARIAAALRDLDVRVALATGSTDPAELGDIPADWLVRPFLPQVTLLGHADLAVTHGGNNSVTEAATAGVPMLVLPLSTDQFAGAAALEDAGLGLALAPNVATVTELRQAAKLLLNPSGGQRAMLDAVASSLTRSPGPQRAFQALAGGIRPEQAAR
jgi:zeaxanthin glucosyltransferase